MNKYLYFIVSLVGRFAGFVITIIIMLWILNLLEVMLWILNLLGVHIDYGGCACPPKVTP